MYLEFVNLEEKKRIERVWNGMVSESGMSIGDVSGGVNERRTSMKSFLLSVSVQSHRADLHSALYEQRSKKTHLDKNNNNNNNTVALTIITTIIIIIIFNLNCK